LRSLMDRNPDDAEVCLHSTLRNLFADKKAASEVAA
jgi:hypothetical protein